MNFCIDKNIENITIDDICFLVNNKIRENVFLDYKLKLYERTNNAKKELLKDVSAFANSLGGDLIIGVEEDKKIQRFNLVGVKSNNISIEIDRIEQIIYSGLEPRLDCFKIKSIEISDNTYIILIRVEKSPLFPHMISFQHNNKFYARKSDKNILLDVYEIKNMFLKSENIEENIKNENKKRITNVFLNSTVVPIINKPKIIINTIPYNYDKINIINLLQTNLKLQFAHKRINFDGLLYYQTNNSGIESYCQIYKNGIIEFVSASNKIFGNVKNPFNFNEKIDVIFGDVNGFENYFLNKSILIYGIIKHLNISVPIYLFISIVDANGYRIIYKDKNNRDKITNTVDRDILELPEIKIKKKNINFKKLLSYSMDIIWNACGEKESVNK